MDKNKPAHLLVIRLSALGDVAMTVPVLLAFANQNPETKLTVLTRPFFRPLFKDIPNVEVYSADVKGKHKGIRGLWRLYKELKPLNVDAVADLHNVLRSNVLKRYFKIARIPFIQIDKGRKEKKELTRPQNKVFKPLKKMVERYADVFRELGFHLEIPNTITKDRVRLPNTLSQRFGRDVVKWIGIAPFAAFKGKMYPIEMMEEVIGELDAKNQYRIFLFGAGDTEKQTLNPISKKYRNAINMVDTLSFEEELALISNLDVMVSMDSANGHLAAMYGVPAVTIWGVTHPYAGFYPYGQDPSNALLADREEYPMIPTSVYGNKFPSGYESAIETISPDQITRKIESLISG